MLFLGLATALCFSAAGGAEGAAIADAGSVPAETAKKSIVPTKYAGKYKGGGSDALATFIKAQCGEGDKFEFTAFFELCTKNGIDAAKVEHYKKLVEDKAHGAEGRARMTLRNMLATPARKNGKLIGLDGAEHEVVIAKAPLTGAAAAAQAASEAKTEEAPAAETPVEEAEVVETEATE
jgi:hypothetical protein